MKFSILSSATLLKIPLIETATSAAVLYKNVNSVNQDEFLDQPDGLKIWFKNKPVKYVFSDFSRFWIYNTSIFFLVRTRYSKLPKHILGTRWANVTLTSCIGLKKT